MEAQAPVKSQARDIETQELSRHSQQIIEQQQQGAAQMHDHCFLCRSQDGLQVAVRCVQAVAKDLSLLAFVDFLLGAAQALGQDRSGFCAGSYLGAHRWRVASILVQGSPHKDRLPVHCRDSINSRSTARAMNSG